MLAAGPTAYRGRPDGQHRIPHPSQQMAAALTRIIWAAGPNTTSQLTVAGVLASPPIGRSLVVDTAADSPPDTLLPRPGFSGYGCIAGHGGRPACIPWSPVCLRLSDVYSLQAMIKRSKVFLDPE
jgi:hypothetical protein